MKPSQNRRRNRLPNKRLQLRLTGLFVGLSAVGLATQYCLSLLAVRGVFRELPGLPDELASVVTDSLAAYSVATALVLLPLTVAVGIFATFRIAGPIYRVEQHLLALARGEELGVCRIRQGDEFQNVVDALNAAVERLEERRGQADLGAALERALEPAAASDPESEPAESEPAEPEMVG